MPDAVSGCLREDDNYSRPLSECVPSSSSQVTANLLLCASYFPFPSAFTCNSPKILCPLPLNPTPHPTQQGWAHHILSGWFRDPPQGPPASTFSTAAKANLKTQPYGLVRWLSSYYSCGTQRFVSRLTWWLATTPTPVPGDLTSSSELWGQQASTWCTYMQVNAHTLK